MGFYIGHDESFYLESEQIGMSFHLLAGGISSDTDNSSVSEENDFSDKMVASSEKVAVKQNKGRKKKSEDK